jgi:hypothetical protein
LTEGTHFEEKEWILVLPKWRKRWMPQRHWLQSRWFTALALGSFLARSSQFIVFSGTVRPINRFGLECRPTPPYQPSDFALPTAPAHEIDVTAPHRPRWPVPRAGLRLIRLVELLGIIILIAITGGAYFEYYASKRSDFETANNTHVRIQPSPSTVESQTESMTLKQLGIRPLFPTVAPPQQQFPETTPGQPGIQPLPPTIESRQQVPEAAPDQPLIEPPPPTIESQPPTASARAENIKHWSIEAISPNVPGRQWYGHGAPAMNDLISGQIAVGFVNITAQVVRSTASRPG